MSSTVEKLQVLLDLETEHPGTLSDYQFNLVTPSVSGVTHAEDSDDESYEDRTLRHTGEVAGHVMDMMRGLNSGPVTKSYPHDDTLRLEVDLAHGVKLVYWAYGYCSYEETGETELKEVALEPETEMREVPVTTRICSPVRLHG